MTFSYTLAKVPTEALHWVRFKVGAVKADAAPKIEDEEITGALVIEGLTATSVPSASNRPALCKAAASVCRSIAASFARQGGAGAPPGGGQTPKNVSAETYLKLAQQLETEATGIATVGGQLVYEPVELIDSVDYRRDRFGNDASEYVGDEVT